MKIKLNKEIFQYSFCNLFVLFYKIQQVFTLKYFLNYFY
jgi:hypothetical protein